MAIARISSDIESTRGKAAKFDVTILDGDVPQDPNDGIIRFRARYGTTLISKSSQAAGEIVRADAETARISIVAADTNALPNRVIVLDYEVTWDPTAEAGAEEYVVVEGRWAVHPTVE